MFISQTTPYFNITSHFFNLLMTIVGIFPLLNNLDTGDGNA